MKIKVLRVAKATRDEIQIKKVLLKTGEKWMFLSLHVQWQSDTLHMSVTRL